MKKLKFATLLVFLMSISTFSVLSESGNCVIGGPGVQDGYCNNHAEDLPGGGTNFFIRCDATQGDEAGSGSNNQYSGKRCALNPTVE